MDLCARLLEGEPLGSRDFVIYSDDTTSIQARCRCHPTLLPGRSRLMRVKHEWDVQDCRRLRDLKRPPPPPESIEFKNFLTTIDNDIPPTS